LWLVKGQRASFGPPIVFSEYDHANMTLAKNIGGIPNKAFNTDFSAALQSQSVKASISQQNYGQRRFS